MNSMDYILIYLISGIFITALAGKRNWLGFDDAMEQQIMDLPGKMAVGAALVISILFWPIFLLLGILQELLERKNNGNSS